MQATIEENERVLSKLADTDKANDELANENEELQARVTSLQDELAATSRACEYFQKDALPTLQKTLDQLKGQMDWLATENDKLKEENTGLKGNFDSSLKHLEQQKVRLNEALASEQVNMNKLKEEMQSVQMKLYQQMDEAERFKAALEQKEMALAEKDE